MRWDVLLLLVATGFQAATAAVLPFESACEFRKVHVSKLESFTVTGNNNRVPNPKASPTELNLSRTSNSRTEQIMTFKLPKDAIGKKCSMFWSVASTKESAFHTQGDTHIQIFQIGPDGKEREVAGAEFGDWVGVDDGRAHSNGIVDCRGTLRFRLVPMFKGKVFLKQNEHSGFYLQYCKS